ncbi:MAG TPA: tetratricopeptide repeat protein, partial [Saprospiraceae bacterium]|nr:tetratricopeptide repeat protein [Saprospiraceae bacterium]
MKPLLLLLVLGLIARTLPLVAQATPDSLRAVLASKASNAQKTEACMDLAIYTAQTSLDSAVAYGHSAVQYAEAQPNLKLKGQAYNVLATAYYVSDNYKAALANYLTSLSLCQKAEDCRGESRAYHNIGNIYLGLGSFAEAAEYYEKATHLHA